MMPPKSFHNAYAVDKTVYGARAIVFNLNMISFPQGLINSVNQFTGQLFKLESWKLVLDQCDEPTKLLVLWGTVQALVEWLFATPSNFRKKLIYCATMLLFDAEEILNGHLGPINEASIGYKTLEKHTVLKQLGLDASGLLSSIRNINTGLVNEYRNELNHRIPRNVELGHSVFAVRNPSGRSVGLSGRSPLTIENAIPLLIHEQKQMKAGFFAYWNFAHSLIDELQETRRV